MGSAIVKGGLSPVWASAGVEKKVAKLGTQLERDFRDAGILPTANRG